MNPQILRRSILAVAIAAVSASALATPATVDMTGKDMTIALTGPVDGFTMTGEATINEDFLQLENAVITGDIVNEANLSGTGDQINAIDIDGDGFGGSTVFNGSLMNTGSLTVNGLGANGILLDNVEMNGSVINSGSINVTGDYDPAENDGATGIKFWNVNSAADNRNDGMILVNGIGATGIQIENSLLEGNLINGNNGVIEVAGQNSTGLAAYQSDIESTVNHGRIAATGDDATGIDYDNVTMRTIINSGVISGAGAGGTGIYLDGVILDRDPDLTSANHGIVNSGLIMGTKYGINVEGDVRGDAIPLYVHVNGGTVMGGDAAINGNGKNIVLNLNGGLIDGNLLGIGDVNVSNWGNISADLISGNAGSTVTVNSNSFLELGNAHTNITQNLTVLADSSLGLYVSPGTDPTKAILNVGGTATFETGSNIVLMSRPTDFEPTGQGTEYLLVNAGKLNADGVNVESVSYLLEVVDYYQQGEQLIAVIGQKSMEEIEDIITESGASSNGQAAFMPLVSLLSRMSATDPIFQAMVNATPQERARLAEQLLPDVSAGTTQAAVTGQGLVSGATNARTGSLRGSSSGDALTETGMWFQVLKSDATQNERGGVEGYNADTTGFTLGADGKLNENLTVGVAYSYLESDVKSDRGNTTDVEGHSLTVYGGLTHNQWFADGNLTYSKNDNSAKRNIASTTATADYDSSMLGLNLEGGYSFDLTPTRSVAPFGILRYATIDVDGYSEKGSSAGLKVSAQKFEIADIGLGVKFSDATRLGKGVLNTELKLSATYDMIGDTANTTSSYVLGGSAFTTSGAKPARTAVNAGIGADYQLGSINVGINYERQERSDFDADTVMAKVRYDF